MAPSARWESFRQFRELLLDAVEHSVENLGHAFEQRVVVEFLLEAFVRERERRHERRHVVHGGGHWQVGKVGWSAQQVGRAAAAPAAALPITLSGIACFLSFAAAVAAAATADFPTTFFVSTSACAFFVTFLSACGFLPPLCLNGVSFFFGFFFFLHHTGGTKTCEGLPSFQSHVLLVTATFFLGSMVNGVVLLGSTNLLGSS